MKLRAILASLLLAAAALPAAAASLRAFADSSFQPVLSSLTPAFEAQTGLTVDWSFAPSSDLLDRLLAGESADLFFPASPDVLRLAVSHGIADPALRRHILDIPPDSLPAGSPPPDPPYLSAVALSASSNRVPVMVLLDFLVSPAARDAFSAAGFPLP